CWPVGSADIEAGPPVVICGGLHSLVIGQKQRPADASHEPCPPAPGNGGPRRICYNQLLFLLVFLKVPIVRELGAEMGHEDQSGSGGTGRHTILMGWRRKAWGVKSPLPHHD